jgi:hypothetical protein
MAAQRNRVLRYFFLFTAISALSFSCTLERDHRIVSDIHESPAIEVARDRSLADGVKITVRNPYSRHLLCRVAAESWIEEPQWKDWVVIYPNVGIGQTIPKSAVWTNMNPLQTILVVWHTNDTWVKLSVTNVRFRAEFRDTNLVPVGDFTTKPFSVQDMLRAK